MYLRLCAYHYRLLRQLPVSYIAVVKAV